MSAKKAEKEKAPETPVTQSLEQMVLDKRSGKYEVVARIAFWAKELRKLEEHRHLTQNDLLERAMEDVLGGKVSEKELIKRIAEAPPPPSAGSEDKPRKGGEKNGKSAD
ncbi:MAG: hypothetical protein AAB339_00455 [Elusimicrobiota bacterium]